MLKTELIVETVGKTDITAMTESEQTSFLDSLYESIQVVRAIYCRYNFIRTITLTLGQLFLI